jgi:hypothetical protein
VRHAVFDWSNTQNGKLIGGIGIISAAIQGGYVRRALARGGELKMARSGTSSCAIGLVALALVPHFALSRPGLAVRLLQAAAICMAFTSATVVNALTAHASLQCDEAPPEFAAVETDDGKPIQDIARLPELAKGQALGRFRSSGQLGRAIGPLLGNRAYSPVVPRLTLSRSVCILLDLRTLRYIRNWRCCYDRSLCSCAKSRASNGFEDGLTDGTLVLYRNSGLRTYYCMKGAAKILVSILSLK